MRVSFLHRETEKGNFFFIISVSLCLFLLMAGSAFAQAPAPDDETYHIAKKLNCPTCAGRNLADCPTDTCAQWKAEIKAQLDQGKTSQEVLVYFQDRFGPTVLQEPPKQGSTAILWAAPVGAAMVFFVAVAIVMARVSKRGTPALATDTAAQSNDDPFVSQLEEDVKRQA
jgi:cytochrome c-type biogenesis protein CcmH